MWKNYEKNTKITHPDKPPDEATMIYFYDFSSSVGKSSGQPSKFTQLGSQVVLGSLSPSQPGQMRINGLSSPDWAKPTNRPRKSFSQAFDAYSSSKPFVGLPRFAIGHM